jgi:hypothetical protein
MKGVGACFVLLLQQGGGDSQRSQSARAQRCRRARRSRERVCVRAHEKDGKRAGERETENTAPPQLTCRRRHVRRGQQRAQALDDLLVRDDGRRLDVLQVGLDLGGRGSGGGRGGRRSGCVFLLLLLLRLGRGDLLHRGRGLLGLLHRRGRLHGY